MHQVRASSKHFGDLIPEHWPRGEVPLAVIAAERRRRSSCSIVSMPSAIVERRRVRASWTIVRASASSSVFSAIPFTNARSILRMSIGNRWR